MQVYEVENEEFLIKESFVQVSIIRQKIPKYMNHFAYFIRQIARLIYFKRPLPFHRTREQSYVAVCRGF